MLQQRRQVVDCASPLALWIRDPSAANRCPPHVMSHQPQSGRGQPQSKTLRDQPVRQQFRQVLDYASPLAFLGPMLMQAMQASRGSAQVVQLATVLQSRDSGER